MYQETGETRDAIIEDDQKQIEKIVNANKHLREVYWIALFAKASRKSLDGKPTLMKYINPYFDKKPQSQVGVILGEVDNVKGEIRWEVNMPQTNFNFEALGRLGAERCDEVVIETTTIPHAYLSK